MRTKKQTSIVYAVDVTVDDFDQITEEDNEGKGEPLFTRLQQLPGVEDVDYDGHFGPFLYITVEPKNDNDELWQHIDNLIEAHIFCPGE